MSGLCLSAEGDRLRALLHPAPVNPAAEPSYVVAADDRIYLMSRAGEIVEQIDADPRPPGFGFSVIAVAVCPSGRRLVEQWPKQIIVRDLQTRAVERRIEQEHFTKLHCLDAEATQLFGYRWIERLRGPELVDIGRDRVIGSGASQMYSFAGTKALHASNAPATPTLTSLAIIDLLTGDTVPLPLGRAISAAALSPNGDRVAIAEAPEGGGKSRIAIYDARASLVAAKNLDLVAPGVQWIGGGKLMVSQFRDRAQVLDATTLALVRELPGESPWSATADPDGALIALQGASLVRVGDDGVITRLATLPIPPRATLLSLVAPHSVADRPRPADHGGQAAPPAAAAPVPAESRESKARTGRAVVLTAAFSIVVVAGLGFAWRRAARRR